MIDKDFKIPFYAKVTTILVGIFALVAMLYFARSILVPIVFSVIIAILLHPVVKFLVRKRFPRVLAIVLALLLTFMFLAGIGLLIFSQTSRFIDSWPLLVDKFTEIVHQTVIWFSGYFDVHPEKINEWILKSKAELLNIDTAGIAKTLVSFGSGLVALFLIPVYIFLILYYQPNLVAFVHKVFGADNDSQVSEILSQTKTVIQRYLSGLLIEFVIVAILNSAALLILGIDYAIVLGIIGALLNLIPYIGGLVGVAIPMIVAIATKSTAWYAFYVLVVYYIIQLIDNNYIVPKIVASKVRINALFSIIAVIAGGALWGVTGMFLSIPLLAIIKLIFDQIEPLKPWGFLLGDTTPSLLKIKLNIKKLKGKAK